MDVVDFRSSRDPEVRAVGALAVMANDERRLRKRLAAAERMAKHKSEVVASRGRLECCQIKMSLSVLARAKKRIHDELEVRQTETR